MVFYLCIDWALISVFVSLGVTPVSISSLTSKGWIFDGLPIWVTWWIYNAIILRFLDINEFYMESSFCCCTALSNHCRPLFSTPSPFRVSSNYRQPSRCSILCLKDVFKTKQFQRHTPFSFGALCTRGRLRLQQPFQRMVSPNIVTCNFFRWHCSFWMGTVTVSVPRYRVYPKEYGDTCYQ